MKRNYLVMVEGSFVDGVATLTRPDGEFGGDGWREWNKSPNLALRNYLAVSKEEAIKQCAIEYELDEGILIAEEMASNTSPLVEAYITEIEYILETQYEDETAPNEDREAAKLIRKNLEEIANDAAQADEDFNLNVQNALYEYLKKHSTEE